MEAQKIFEEIKAKIKELKKSYSGIAITSKENSLTAKIEEAGVEFRLDYIEAEDKLQVFLNSGDHGENEKTDPQKAFEKFVKAVKNIFNE